MGKTKKKKRRRRRKERSSSSRRRSPSISSSSSAQPGQSPRLSHHTYSPPRIQRRQEVYIDKEDDNSHREKAAWSKKLAESLMDDLMQDTVFRNDCWETEFDYVDHSPPPSSTTAAAAAAGSSSSTSVPQPSYDEWVDDILAARDRKRKDRVRKEEEAKKRSTSRDSSSASNRHSSEFYIEQQHKEEELKKQRLLKKQKRLLEKRREEHQELWMKLRSISQQQQQHQHTLLPFPSYLPVLHPPTDYSTPDSLDRFLSVNLLSDFLFQESSSLEERRKIIKTQQLLWHPDKFNLLLHLFHHDESDRGYISKAALHVIKKLNEISARLSLSPNN